MMYYFFILGKIIALGLPRAVVYFLAKIFALAHFCFSAKDRQAVYYNLKPLLDNQAKKNKVAKKVFINFAYYLTDFFRYSKLNIDFIKKYVRIEGLEAVDRLAAQKQGAILVTAHLGNYELGGAVMSLLGYPLSAVALPHLDLRTNNFFNRQRRRVGIEVIPADSSVRESISALKNGRFLALLGDRDFSRSGRKQLILSRYAYIPRGVAFFARKSQTGVIPVFFVRENKYHYRLIFEKEIARGPSLPEESEIIKRYVAVLEKYLRKYPEQWYMFQKYWH